MDTVRQVDTHGFQTLMAGFPTGVAIVTAMGEGDVPHGLTCSSLCSVSLNPPLLLVCITNHSGTLRAMTSSGAFAVNMLHDRGQHAARRFAKGGPNRFEAVRWSRTGQTGLPYLYEDAHTVAECVVHSTEVAGDHTIIVGAVRAVESLTVGPPLLYGMRQYATWPGVCQDGRVDRGEER